MSYAPTTDFLGLLRQTSGGMRFLQMPGLDFVVAALARAGLINLSVGQTAPIVDQTNTVWFKPAQPSWTAEGTLYIWNVATNVYEVATHDLWEQLLAGAQGYQFQDAPDAANTVIAGTSLLAIRRVAPLTTTVTLPTLASQRAKALQVVDWSTNVANHVVTIMPSGGATIMQLAQWQFLSTAVSLGGITFYPSADLNGWVIAP